MSPCCPGIRQRQGVPALLPLPCFRLPCEAEAQTHGTAEGQDCWGSPWHGTALAPPCLVSRAEGHQPEGDSDPHDVHFREKCIPVSAEGALEASNAGAHSLSLQEKQKGHE